MIWMLLIFYNKKSELKNSPLPMLIWCYANISRGGVHVYKRNRKTKRQRETEREREGEIPTKQCLRKHCNNGYILLKYF